MNDTSLSLFNSISTKSDSIMDSAFGLSASQSSSIRNISDQYESNGTTFLSMHNIMEKETSNVIALMRSVVSESHGHAELTKNTMLLSVAQDASNYLVDPYVLDTDETGNVKIFNVADQPARQSGESGQQGERSLELYAQQNHIFALYERFNELMKNPHNTPYTSYQSCPKFRAPSLFAKHLIADIKMAASGKYDNIFQLYATLLIIRLEVYRMHAPVTGPTMEVAHSLFYGNNPLSNLSEAMRMFSKRRNNEVSTIVRAFQGMNESSSIHFMNEIEYESNDHNFRHSKHLMSNLVERFLSSRIVERPIESQATLENRVTDPREMATLVSNRYLPISSEPYVGSTFHMQLSSTMGERGTAGICGSVCFSVENGITTIRALEAYSTQDTSV